MKRVCLALLLGILCSGGMALAQAGGSLTGTIEGVVKIGDNPVPGVLVTIESPALQGKRSVGTGVNGDYIFRAASSRHVRHHLHPDRDEDGPALGSRRPRRNLAAGRDARGLDGHGRDRLGREHRRRRGEDRGTQLDLHRRHDSESPGRPHPRPDRLARARVDHEHAERTGQLSISGAFAYDNKFLLNGVDINDNLFGHGDEPARDRRGGSGNAGHDVEHLRRIRRVLGRHHQRDHEERRQRLFRIRTRRLHEPELAGVQPERGEEPGLAARRTSPRRTPRRSAERSSSDRLWFFLAGRYIDRTTTTTLPVTSEAVTTPTNGTPHRGQAHRQHQREPYAAVRLHLVEPARQRTSRRSPSRPRASGDSRIPSNRRASSSASYNGVFTPALIGSLRYSEKKFQFKGSGGTNPDLVAGTPFFSDASGTQDFLHYHAPYFDATDPEDRNNQDFAGSLSYYVSAGKLGTHDLKVGVDIYKSIHSGGNSQSPTNFVFYADYKTDAAGNPVYDANQPPSSRRSLPASTSCRTGSQRGARRRTSRRTPSTSTTRCASTASRSTSASATRP